MLKLCACGIFHPVELLSFTEWHWYVIGLKLLLAMWKFWN